MKPIEWKLFAISIMKTKLLIILLITDREVTKYAQTYRLKRNKVCSITRESFWSPAQLGNNHYITRILLRWLVHWRKRLLFRRRWKVLQHLVSVTEYDVWLLQIYYYLISCFWFVIKKLLMTIRKYEDVFLNYNTIYFRLFLETFWQADWIITANCYSCVLLFNFGIDVVFHFPWIHIHLFFINKFQVLCHSQLNR